MKLERAAFLGAAPGERTDARTDHVNGFQGKALRTRLGELALRVPQVRPLPGGEPLRFDPKSLERGLRSERALKLAIVENYVQGISTRRVTEITRAPCGLEVTKLITSDDHAGLRAARRAVFPNLPWQRCQFHLQQNAQAYAPQVTLRPQVARDLRSIFHTADRSEADERLAKLVEKYWRPTPRLAEWMETNVPEGLAVFALSDPYRRRLRTTNALERLNRELHRRTRVATLFPNEASLLRLVTALAAEISEEWETGRVYLNPESE